MPQTWNQPFRQKPLSSFHEKWYLETTVWMVGVFIALGLGLVSRFFNGQSLSVLFLFKNISCWYWQSSISNWVLHDVYVNLIFLPFPMPKISVFTNTNIISLYFVPQNPHYSFRVTEQYDYWKVVFCFVFSCLFALRVYPFRDSGSHALLDEDIFWEMCCQVISSLCGHLECTNINLDGTPKLHDIAHCS